MRFRFRYFARAATALAGFVLTVGPGFCDQYDVPKKRCAGSAPEGGPYDGCDMTLSTCSRYDDDVQVVRTGRDVFQKEYGPEEKENCDGENRPLAVDVKFNATWTDVETFGGPIAEQPDLGPDEQGEDWETHRAALRQALGVSDNNDIGPIVTVSYEVAFCQVAVLEAGLAYRADARAQIEHAYLGIFRGPDLNPNVDPQWALPCQYDCEHDLGTGGGDRFCGKTMSTPVSYLEADVGLGVREEITRRGCDGPCGDDGDDPDRR